MGVYLLIAARNIVQARRRTFLLGLALAMVTALLVLLLSLSRGVMDTMIRSATTVSAGHLNITGFFKPSATDAAIVINDVAAVRKKVAEFLPEVDFIVDRQRGWSRIVSPASSLQAGLSGLEISEERRFVETIQLAKESDYVDGGRDEIIGDVRSLAKPNHALLFASQAKRLRVQVGDTITVTIETFSGLTNSAELVVGAVAKDMGMLTNWNVFMSKPDIRKLYNLQSNSTGSIQIHLKDVERSEALLGTLAKGLEGAGYTVMEHDPNPFFFKFDNVMAEDWVGQRLDVTTWRDEVSFVTWVLTAIDLVSFLLISILLVIIVIGIMNAIWMSVRERTAEVGTLRAVGMHQRRVLMMFLVEALMLGALATGIGALGGAGIALAIDAARLHIPVEGLQAILMSDTLHLAVRPGQVLGATLAFTLVTGLSALWPAYRASKLQPVTAIHHVG